jgi:transcriptional regulator with XRE-family HTH domain
MCGLVQYRTRNNFCRRCLHILPPVKTFAALPAPTPPIDVTETQGAPCDNLKIVEGIGARLRRIRESTGMVQSELTRRSNVSRSYLSRIEVGAMIPSVETCERICEGLRVGLRRLFLPESNGELLIEDPFIAALRPCLGRLDDKQRKFILKTLAAISPPMKEIDPRIKWTGHKCHAWNNGRRMVNARGESQHTSLGLPYSKRKSAA